MFEAMAKAGLKKLIRNKMKNNELKMSIEELMILINEFTDHEIKLNYEMEEDESIIIIFKDLNNG